MSLVPFASGCAVTVLYYTPNVFRSVGKSIAEVRRIIGGRRRTTTKPAAKRRLQPHNCVICAVDDAFDRYEAAHPDERDDAQPEGEGFAEEGEQA